MINLVDKRRWIKPGQWCWVVQNEDDNRQNRFIAMILDKPYENEVQVTYVENNSAARLVFKSGIVEVSEIIILHNCTGWDYQP